jgi:hypothetical protein
MGQSTKTAKAKGDSLESAIQILERAILIQSPSYSEKTFRFEAKKIISVAGVHHELDIWVSVDHGSGYEAIFIFECKNWRKKVTKNDFIVFSEKIKVAEAQKGFFVAKSFTRDAKAQAKTDPRIQLLRVRELEFVEVPEALQHFHILNQAGFHAECNIKLKVDQETGQSYAIDMNATEIILDGQTRPMQQDVEEWQREVIAETTNSFRSEHVPEGAYTLPFEYMREFEVGGCFVNGEPVAHIKLSGRVEVQIWRAVIESQFEVENRGRAYRAIINTSFGQVVLSAHELAEGAAVK